MANREERLRGIIFKKKIDIAFVILCYRETEDIVNIINNINKYSGEFAIIVVNSYFDERTKSIIEFIASENNCDFINVENKGYGYGNNRGIEYANEKYEFDFLCICNPDILFTNLPLDLLTKDLKAAIVAPNIITKNGKKQNPYYYTHLSIIDWFKYLGLVKNIKGLYFVGVAINKVIRTVFNILGNRKRLKIYACHGSCLFIGQRALEKLETIYNEQMFLFHEEEHLARLAHQLSISTVFMKDIKVTHFEDGSSESIKDSTFKYMKQSYSEYYKYWKNRSDM